MDFSGSKAKINGLYLFNGYRKSFKHWRENSRVKKLFITMNHEPFLILELADTYKMQSIDSKTISLKKIKTMRFKILEVYQGEKYNDTGISEIRLEGIHHH